MTKISFVCELWITIIKFWSELWMEWVEKKKVHFKFFHLSSSVISLSWELYRLNSNKIKFKFYLLLLSKEIICPLQYFLTKCERHELWTSAFIFIFLLIFFLVDSKMPCFNLKKKKGKRKSMVFVMELNGIPHFFQLTF